MMAPVLVCLLVTASLLAEHLPKVAKAAHLVNYPSVKSGQNSSKKARSKKGSTIDRNKRVGPGPIDPDKPGGPREKRHYKRARKHHKKS